jgi:hypothetical protein
VISLFYILTGVFSIGSDLYESLAIQIRILDINLAKVRKVLTDSYPQLLKNSMTWNE